MDLEHHHIALAHAEHAYNKLVGAFHEGVTAAHLLLDDKCNEASNYRGFLLGCPWGTGATLDELYVARLKTDISQAGEKGGGRWRAVSELRGMLCRCNHSDTSGRPDFLATRYLQMLRNCLRIHLV